MLSALELPREEIEAVCERLGVEELSVFGSVIREDFDPARSDIDFLVRFKGDDAGPWLEKYTELETALTALLGHRVDIVPKRAVEASDNYIRRKHILSSAKILYVA